MPDSGLICLEIVLALRWRWSDFSPLIQGHLNTTGRGVMQFAADILLVEDDPNDAELIRSALKKRDIPGEVVHLADGDQFMDSIFYASLYSSWHDIKIPKVIMLDLKLKTVNGLDVLRLLKADSRAR